MENNPEHSTFAVEIHDENGVFVGKNTAILWSSGEFSFTEPMDLKVGYALRADLTSPQTALLFLPIPATGEAPHAEDQ